MTSTRPSPTPASPSLRIDGRRLSHATCAAIRRIAIQRVQAGEPASRVVRSFGFCRTTIYKWLRTVRAGGMEALAPRRHPGRRPTVSADDVRKVAEWIVGRSPRDHGLEAALWSRRAVQHLVSRRLGVSLSLVAIGRVMRRGDLRPTAARYFHQGPSGSVPRGVLAYGLDARGRFVCTAPRAGSRWADALTELVRIAGPTAGLSAFGTSAGRV